MTDDRRKCSFPLITLTTLIPCSFSQFEQTSASGRLNIRVNIRYKRFLLYFKGRVCRKSKYGFIQQKILLHHGPPPMCLGGSSKYSKENFEVGGQAV